MCKTEKKSSKIQPAPVLARMFWGRFRTRSDSIRHKTYLVVDSCDLQEAKQLFGPLGVNVTNSHRLLGGHLGSPEDRSRFVLEKATEWVKSLSCLSKAAEKLPQDAFAALSRSLMQEWSYVQRVVPGCGPALQSVEKAMAEGFLPKLFGCEVSPAERKLCELPIKMAGLGVTNPSTSAPVAYGVSRKATIHLVNAITGKEEFDPGRHHESVAKARQEARLSREKELPTKFDTCVSALGGLSERCARRAKDFSTGAWLSAMPSEKNNTFCLRRSSGMDWPCASTSPCCAFPAPAMAVGKGSHWTTASTAPTAETWFVDITRYVMLLGNWPRWALATWHLSRWFGRKGAETKVAWSAT